ncbi:MAG: helix-turn-helix domain-containing protein [Aeromicrobium sp.]
MPTVGNMLGETPSTGWSIVPPDSSAWLEEVASAAAVDAGAPAELLGEYLPLLAEAAIRGRRPGPKDVARIGELGSLAAQQGVAPGAAVNLYLSAASRLWRELPLVNRSGDSEVVRAAAEAVLQVVGDAVAALVEGHQAERRQAIRQEESLRAEFIDDLLRGDTDVARMVERAEPFGLDLTRGHRVALATPASRRTDLDQIAAALETAVVRAFGDRDVLVATKEGVLVVLVPEASATGRELPEVGSSVHAVLARHPARRRWQVAVGRPYAGAYGIARSYEEAREARDLAGRLGWDRPVVSARDVLIYRVIGRDQGAMVDLMQVVLTPLEKARGGAEPLVKTIETYLAAGSIATEAARRLHLSVRAVTYRLERVRTLTGLDPADAEQAFTLHAAVLGARLLGWPAQPLPRNS